MDEARINSVLEQWSRAVEDNSTLLASGYTPRTSIEQLVDKYTKDDEQEHLASVKAVRPWNYEDFLARVRTYQPTTWFAKPDGISPLQCARWGWFNSANDELKCNNCHSTIQHEISSDVDGTLLAEQFSTAHADICPWRDNACPESFTQFPARSAQQLRDEFNARAKAILPLLKSYPGCECVCPDGFLEAAGDQDLAAFVDRLQSTGVLTTQPKQTDNAVLDGGRDILAKSVLLSIFGWDRQTAQTGEQAGGDGSARLECRLCGRRLQLQYFDDGASTGPEPHADSDSTKLKRAKVSKPTLNPAREHRSYCPWVLSSDDHSSPTFATPTKPTSSGSDASLDPIASSTVEAWSIAGWRVCLQVLNAAMASVQYPATPDSRGSEHAMHSQSVTPEEAYYKIKKVLDLASRST